MAKILEKSGNFFSPEKWEPCLLRFLYTVGKATALPNRFLANIPSYLHLTETKTKENSHFPIRPYSCKYSHLLGYRSGTVNSNTVNSKFYLIRSYCEIFLNHFPNISCLKCTVNLNFHLIRRKTLLTNDFELTVRDLY